MTARYWFLIFILGIGWGSSFIFNEILLREVGPFTMSLGRTGLGALGCWVYALAVGKSVFQSPLIILGMVLLGTINYAIPFAVYPVSQQYLAGGVAGIINAMTPVMVVIVSQFWPGGEKATFLKTLGILAGFAGIAVLTLPSIEQGAQSEIWAILIALIAPVCYGIAVNMARRYKDLDPVILAMWSLTGGALVIGPVAFTLEGLPHITQAETWFSFAIIGFVLTSASFMVMFWLLPRVGATATSTVTFIAPVSSIWLGSLVLGEQVENSHLIGMAIMFVGLLLIDGRLFGRKKATTIKV
ncbi:DMT family transporter [Cochlodiniinecator piscidefendens]|uniref:DMT family transporter n=1 Tax=Cochlodiniinecator piscidefendens TaxID=2715756 RepID=UPI00140D74BE|nr:DMT family transporter [Cochlodiniinecator piscidefendens]